MRDIDIVYRTMFAELGQRCLDAQFVRDFPIEAAAASFATSGSFFRMSVKGRDYWYHQSSNGEGKRRQVYVGPADDPEITQRVAEFGRLKDDLRGRRKLVSTLVREAGIPAPDRLTGDVVAALADAGLFRLRGVLVGTVAFQCYAGLLGLRMPSSSLQTGDADFAQFQSISAALGDTLPPMLEVLREVDPTFREIPSRSDPARTTQYESKGYRVEFLTPNTGSADHEDKPATMPALGGASAHPLRFLDFLIQDPVRSVLLHRSGVSVIVPAPERFAVHKLIVATRRRGDAGGILKREKDLRQARLLMEALVQTRRHAELADIYAEAWRRGPSWREAISQGMAAIDQATGDLIGNGLVEGFRRNGEEPSKFGLG